MSPIYRFPGTPPFRPFSAAARSFMMFFICSTDSGTFSTPSCDDVPADPPQPQGAPARPIAMIAISPEPTIRSRGFNGNAPLSVVMSGSTMAT